jgi:hypothetical protein
MLLNAPIPSLKGQSVTFTGQQLNQEDLEVWLQVLNLARSHPLGEICHTSAHGLLNLDFSNYIGASGPRI